MGKEWKSHFSDKNQKDSVLYQVKWWRVILDEAHNIKGETTQQAKACSALEAKHKWLLTGTPLPNKIDELYS